MLVVHYFLYEGRMGSSQCLIPTWNVGLQASYYFLLWEKMRNTTAEPLIPAFARKGLGSKCLPRYLKMTSEASKIGDWPQLLHMDIDTLQGYFSWN